MARSPCAHALAVALFLPGLALAAEQVAQNLIDLSLEQLSNIVVSTVSRRDEPLLRAPASIFVISRDDIRRSGSTSLPEALRLAPNLNVARADANQYAIAARGFNGTAANKMLVLIDGRTVYSPLFSGTFWEAQDVLLEDVERIEVISGPGSTLWGANAVNGVINVITREAADSQGVMASARAGTTQRDAGARYGGRIGEGHYRVYAKTVRRDNTSMGNGTPIRDGADHQQAGFRIDWGSAAQGFTLQGDAYGSTIEQAPQAREISGLNLLARWNRRLQSGGSVRVQAYLDSTARDQPGTIREHLTTYDLELQHALAPSGRHMVMWGFGLRQYRDSVASRGPLLAFLPNDRNLTRNHLFAQDQIALGDAIDLTVGAKVETNSYTGSEWLPSARLTWRPSLNQMVWAAASRAVRAPSRLDRELFSPATPPFALAGGPNFQSEISKVYELGYRAQPSPQLSFSITAFYHDHESLRSLTAAPGGAVFENNVFGKTQGFEGWGTWRVTDGARLSGGLVRQRQRLQLRPGTTDLSGALTQTDPDGWWKLRAAFDLSPRHELDVMLRHYGALPGPSIPAYTAADARFGWRFAKDMELSLLAQNLFDKRHPEWGIPTNRAEFERAVFIKLRFGL